MPRRRTTRAAAKRPSPTLPDDDDDVAKIDKEQRKEKVQALIKDFNNEVQSRIRNLRACKQEMLRQIDLAYTVEYMRIRPEHRAMKLTDYLALLNKAPDVDTVNDNQTEPAAMNELETFISSSSSKPEMPVIMEEGRNPSTTRKLKLKPKKDEGVFQVPQTTRTGRSRKPSANQTPASHMPMVSLATPLITPKFDMSLYQTPAVLKRNPKPHEIIMSKDGSPLMNTNDASSNAFIFPIDGSKSICVRDLTELSSLDSTTAQVMLRRLDEMKETLQSVVSFKPQPK